MAVCLAGQRLNGHVEVDVSLAAVLERAGLVLPDPTLMLALPLPSPRLALSPDGPSLRDEQTAKPGGESAQQTHTSDEEWHPRSSVHLFIMEASSPVRGGANGRRADFIIFEDAILS